MLWIIGGVAALSAIFLVVAAYVYYQRNIATRHIFIVNYNLVHERTGSVDEALRQAIEVFRYRHPFDSLDDNDVDHLIAVFSRHSKPLVMASLFHNVDQRQDRTILKDHDWVLEVANATETSGTRVAQVLEPGGEAQEVA